MNVDTPTKKIDVDTVFRALSDRTRLRILNLLRNREMCVCDLISILDVPQPTASRHLANLRNTGLILARKEGLWHYYRLAPSQSKFHQKLLDCLEVATHEISQLTRDLEQQKSIAKSNNCN